MCNAWNHPPDCSCGWGGVWYGTNGGGDDWLFNQVPRPRTLGYQRDTATFLASNFTNPNAQCPVCNAPVFFFQSSYGGRVFFDELGPPWPKHACTDQKTVPSKLHNPFWQRDGWRPLSSVHIDGNRKLKGVYSITGQQDERRLQFHFRSNEIVVADIVRFQKSPERGVFFISILYYDPKTKSWNVASITAFTDEERANSDDLSAEIFTISRNSNLKLTD